MFTVVTPGIRLSYTFLPKHHPGSVSLMIYMFGISLALFLFVLILIKKNKSRPDYILLMWMGVIAVHMMLFYLDYRKVSYEYPHLLGVTLPLPVLHGVFLYFYTVELIRKETQLTLGKSITHLIPFFLLIILAIPFYRLTGEEKIEVFRQAGRGYEWYTMIQTITFMFFGFAYSVASIIEIRKCRRQLLDNFSNVDKKMLRWLEYLAIGLAIIWLVSAFFSDEAVFGTVVLFVMFIGFFGISQYPVFYAVTAPEISPTNRTPETPLKASPIEGADDTIEKYSKSKLRDDEASDVMTRLERMMSNQKPFTNAELTLNELASSINVSPNHLSQVINSLSGKTFYHYINTHRIGEFLKLSSLPENRKFTYQGLAQQCGFSSKTTFNKYFKLQTGKTPSEYFG